MKKQLKKVNSLLNFYKKQKVNIILIVALNNSIKVKGEIIKKNFFGRKYVIISGLNKSPIKIFIEDIDSKSIIPVDYEKRDKEKRSPLPPALRHKILKRDRFTCQACGARSPDVELEVDHKVPVFRGGTDDESNLTTLCKECNRGKGKQI